MPPTTEFNLYNALVENWEGWRKLIGSGFDPGWISGPPTPPGYGHLNEETWLERIWRMHRRHKRYLRWSTRGYAAAKNTHPYGANKAVSCVFRRSQGRLCCSDGSTTKCCNSFITGRPIEEGGPVCTDETVKNFGPLPLGEYMIGNRRDDKDKDWHNLHRVKIGGGVADYDENNKDGRNLFAFHFGSESHGCATGTNEDCFRELSDFLEKGYVHVGGGPLGSDRTFRGYLRVEE